MPGKITDLLPTGNGLHPLTDSELAEALERARKYGYTVESSVINRAPWTHRIRLNDPAREGYHRDYIARLEP